MKDLIDELFGPDVFHVHLEWRLEERRHAHLHATLLMKFVLDRVIHQSNQTSSDDDAGHGVSYCR